MCPLSGGHRADKCDLVHLFGEPGQAVTKLDAGDIRANAAAVAADLRAGIGFWIQGVDMCHASGHEEVDDTLGLATPCSKHSGVSCAGLLVEKMSGCASNGQPETGLGRGGKKSTA